MNLGFDRTWVFDFGAVSSQWGGKLGLRWYISDFRGEITVSGRAQEESRAQILRLLVIAKSLGIACLTASLHAGSVEARSSVPRRILGVS